MRQRPAAFPIYIRNQDIIPGKDVVLPPFYVESVLALYKRMVGQRPHSLV